MQQISSSEGKTYQDSQEVTNIYETLRFITMWTPVDYPCQSLAGKSSYNFPYYCFRINVNIITSCNVRFSKFFVPSYFSAENISVYYFRFSFAVPAQVIPLIILTTITDAAA